jgi:hypothetical protein
MLQLLFSRQGHQVRVYESTRFPLVYACRVLGACSSVHVASTGCSVIRRIFMSLPHDPLLSGLQVVEDDQQQQLNGFVQQPSSMPGSSSSVGSLHPTSSSSGGLSTVASQGVLEPHATGGSMGAFPSFTGGAQSDSGEAATRGRGAQQFNVGTWPFNTSSEPKRCNSKL